MPTIQTYNNPITQPTLSSSLTSRPFAAIGLTVQLKHPVPSLMPTSFTNSIDTKLQTYFKDAGRSTIFVSNFNSYRCWQHSIYTRELEQQY